MTVYLVAGWTERIRMVMLADGVALDLTGYAVELVSYNSTGTLTLLGTSGIDTAVSGIASFDPNPADLVTGKMKVRWKLTDPLGKVSFFPNSVDPDIWVVSKA